MKLCAECEGTVRELPAIPTGVVVAIAPAVAVAVAALVEVVVVVHQQHNPEDSLFHSQRHKGLPLSLRPLTLVLPNSLQSPTSMGQCFRRRRKPHLARAQFSMSGF